MGIRNLLAWMPVTTKIVLAAESPPVVVILVIAVYAFVETYSKLASCGLCVCCAVGAATVTVSLLDGEAVPLMVNVPEVSQLEIRMCKRMPVEPDGAVMPVIVA